MNYRRVLILFMLIIMVFPIVYSAAYPDKAFYNLLSDEQKPIDNEDGEKDCKDDVTKCFHSFFNCSINNCSSWSDQLLPLNNSAMPTEHFAKVQSPPPDVARLLFS